MRLDIRLVIGAAFLAFGLLLAGYGAAHAGDPALRPTGIPITLVWGLVMLGFGAFMAWRARAARRPADGPPAGGGR